MDESSSAINEASSAEIESFLNERLRKLAPVTTTRTPSGVIIDWVPRDAQLGEVAIAAPPASVH